jgi:gliding motility-associated-like protein
MDNQFSNFDEAFKNAFHKAEAPYSQAEMHADWSQVSKNLPQVHAPQPGPHNVAGHVSGGLGKIIGFSGLGAAVVASAVILYNVYIKPVDHKQTSQEIVAEKQVISHSTTGENNQVNSDQKTVNPDNSTKPGSKINTGGNSRGHDFNTDNKVSNNNENPVNPFTTNPQQNPDNNTTKGGGDHKNSVQTQALILTLSANTACINEPVVANVNSDGGGMTINWGDGTTEPIYRNTSHVYSNQGKYNIQVSDQQRSASNSATIIAKPKASFNYRQESKLKCQFTNKSSQSSGYSWNFGDGSIEEHERNAEHIYSDTGRYLVRLVAYNGGQCADTITKYVNVSDITTPHLLTNVITPNGDNMNDDVYVVIKDETYFMFTIVDRFGQIVFQAQDKNLHWNGKNQFTGADCPAGGYYYSVTYTLKGNSEPQVLRGSISIKR